MRLLLLLLSLLAPVALASLPATGGLGGDDEFLPVEQAFPFNWRQQGDQLQLEWAIADGYYLYRDRISLTPGEGVSHTQPQLPAGHDYDDPYFGATTIYIEPLAISVPLTAVADDGQLTISWQGCAKKGLCYPPVSETIPLKALLATPAAAPAAPPASASASAEPGYQQLLADSGRGWALLIFLGAGLLLAFTPCVLPLLPILSAVLAGGGETTIKRSLLLSSLYVQGMALTYAALGLLVAYFGLKLQAALQSPWLLGGLALLFVLLSLSMFGLFTLQLPASWQSRLHHQGDRLGSGYPRAFGMGVLAGLVATPCTTAPLTGALAYVAQSGDLLLGGTALYLLGLGMGLPLIAIGASGGKLLMRSGSWMNGVKRAFGYLLLAGALLFLDRLLPGQFGRWLWLALALVALADLLWPVGRSWRPLALLLKLGLSALLLAGLNWQWQLLSTSQASFSCAQRTSGQFCDLSVAELPAALAAAAAAGQPVVVDLYADWCVACKEFEHKTFPQPEVQAELARMVAIRVDLTRIDSAANALLQQYQVVGLPTLLLIDSHGQEQTPLRVTGFMDGPTFAARLAELK